MPDPGGGDARGIGATIRKRWRGWLRAVHRDLGYLAVGFTLIYALSGLAINHVKDWDPNFRTSHRERTIAPIPAEVPDAQAIATAVGALGLGTPTRTYRAGDELHLDYDRLQVVVYGDTGQVVEDGRSPRLFLRIANWLHYNRGKAAWTYVADAYAAMLLYLALSGLFMIKGRLGLRWRGALLAGLGVAVPIGYVVLSGGPEAHQGAAVAASPADAPAGLRPLPPDEPDEPGQPGRPGAPGAADAAGLPAGLRPLPPDEPGQPAAPRLPAGVRPLPPDEPAAPGTAAAPGTGPAAPPAAPTPR